MFEQRLTVEEDDLTSCADALVASILDRRRAEAHRLLRVARWADLNHPDRDAVRKLPRAERVRRAEMGQIAAEGTPAVSMHAVTELGMLLQSTTYAAEALLRDVLELRHRLPAHWDAILEGRVDPWKAREVAKATRCLSFEAARAVDLAVLEAVLGLPWGRAKDVLAGKVIAADPEGHQARLTEDQNKRYVSTRRGSNNAGFRTLIARGAAGDIARLEAMVAHLATLLQTHGDPDPADTRRAKALAMLANPALTCLYLAQTHDAGDAADAADAAQPLVAEAVAELDEPDEEPVEEPTEEEPGSVSPVELAITFGRMLQSPGTKVIDRLRPRTVLYLHLSAEALHNLPGTAVARVEGPLAGGPIGIPQLRQWLTHDHLTVQPVLDPTGAEPVDGYEVPLHLREATHLLTPYEVFPWGTLTSRQADKDHTIPYLPLDRGGPPGQTALDNLGALGRRHHLAKTFAGIEVHQPVQGTYLWHTPTGHWYQVDHRGTTYTGTTRPAILDTTAAHLDTHQLSEPERRLRDLVLRHHAA